MVSRGRYALALAAWLLPQAASADGGTTLSGSAEFGVRMHPQAGGFPDQVRVLPSLAGTVTLGRALGPGAHDWRFTAFARVDAFEESRTHWDVREAAWTWTPGQGWRIRTGILSEHWGSTESNRLVDVVNQRDRLEAPTLDARLGQPGLAISRRLLGGELEVMALPWHRAERQPGRRGRLRGATVGRVEPRYDHEGILGHGAVAARWQLRRGDVETAVSRFAGTSREVSADLSSPTEVAYPFIGQWGLEVQVLRGSTAFKADVIDRTGDGRRFRAVTTGLEHSIPVAQGDASLIVELNLDGRGATTPTGLDRDVFLGAQWSSADSGTRYEVGSSVDVRTGAQFVTAAASLRFRAAWRWDIEVFLPLRQRAPQVGHLVRRDGFLSLSISRFF